MTIVDAQRDWRILDRSEFICANNQIRLVTHVEHFMEKHTQGLGQVEEVKKGRISRWCSSWRNLSQLIWAFQVLWEADNKTVIIANGSSPVGDYICILNYYLYLRKKTILYWDSHIEPKTKLKKYFAKRCFLGCRLATVWSRKQIRNYSEQFNLPKDLFIFLPYKANHSQWAPRHVPTLSYIFAGGNGKRDYKTLVEAVRDTDVTVIISATNPVVRSAIGDLPNVIPLGASEPSFAKLMAGSRFVVMPLFSTGVKGGGEANFCNAMWHGKALIAVDDISAMDYIIEGETGYTVPTGDIDLLRKRILELWADKDKCRKMGEKGRELVVKYYTHDLYMRRLIRLAYLLGEEAFADCK